MCLHVYVCMYVCMYVYMYVCMYVYMYVLWILASMLLSGDCQDRFCEGFVSNLCKTLIYECQNIYVCKMD